MAKLKTGRHTGALKAVRKSERRAQRNRGIKKQVKTVAKELLAAVNSNNKEKATELLKNVASTWDKACKGGVLHKNTASRKKSRLTKLVNSMK